MQKTNDFSRTGNHWKILQVHQRLFFAYKNMHCHAKIAFVLKNHAYVKLTNTSMPKMHFYKKTIFLYRKHFICCNNINSNGTPKRTFERFDEQSNDQPVDRSDGQTVERSNDRTVGRSNGRTVGRSNGRTIGRSDSQAVAYCSPPAARITSNRILIIATMRLQFPHETLLAQHYIWNSARI